MSETVTVLSRYVKEDGVIYYEWKLVDDKEWQRRPTPYTEVPYVTFTHIPEEEYKLYYNATPQEQPIVT